MTVSTTTAECRSHLELLNSERALALETSLRNDRAYMADLEEEIISTRHAYIAAAVVEIARLREDLVGVYEG